MAFQPRFWKKLNDEQKIQILSYLYTGEFLEVEPRPVEWVGEILLKKLIDEKVTRQTLYNLMKWLETSEDGKKEYIRLKNILLKGELPEKEEQEILRKTREYLERRYIERPPYQRERRINNIMRFYYHHLKKFGKDQLNKPFPFKWDIDDIMKWRVWLIQNHTRSVCYRLLDYARRLWEGFGNIPSEEFKKGGCLAQIEKPSKVKEEYHYLTIGEIQKLLDNKELFDDVLFHMMLLHINLGCREGSRLAQERLNGWEKRRFGILGLKWEHVNWEAKTIDVFEAKTKGGIYWKGCYMDTIIPNVSQWLYSYWEKLGKPKQGYIFNVSYDTYTNFILYVAIFLDKYIIKQTKFTQESTKIKIIKKYAKQLGKTELLNAIEQKYDIDILLRPHDMRVTHASLLAEMGVPFELIAGKPQNAYLGVGWDDLTTMYKFYIALTERGRIAYESIVKPIQHMAFIEKKSEKEIKDYLQQKLLAKT